jgi:hypothetical protein
MAVYRKTYSGFEIVILCVLLFAGCSRTPGGIIPERKMKDVLVDMQIAEAMVGADPATFVGNEEKAALYATVFRKHGVTETAYDSSLVWYGKHLDVYLHVHKSALAEVENRITELGNVAPEATPDANRDSLDVWIFHRYFELSPRALTNTVVFDIEPDVAYSSGSTFVFGMNVWGVTPRIGKPVEMHLRTVSDDTTYSASATIRENGYHELALKTSPLRKTQRIYGYIRLDGKADAYHKIYLDRFQLTKYRYSLSVAETEDGKPAATETETLD